jgi:hypothetical protein
MPAEGHMAARFGVKSVAIAVVAVAIAAGIGYWGYGAYKKRELRNSVGSLIKGAGERMREALALQLGPLTADRAAAVKALEGRSAESDKALEQLKRLPVERDRALTDAADSYLFTVREVLRTQARMYTFYQRHTESLEALRDHMRMDDRRGAWVAGAVRAKDRAERDFREYRLANAHYATLLGSFATSQKKVEAALGRENLAAPDQITRAREKALAIAQESADEMEKVRKLVPR